LLLAGSNVLYLIGTIWLIVMWKTHVVHPRFLLGGAVIMFIIATLMAFAFLVGVITSSTAVSIMSTYGLFFFGVMLVGHERIAAAVSKEWQAWVINTLYWIVPKTAELGGAVVAFVSAGQAPEKLAQQLTWSPFLTTGAFAIGCIVLASWLFTRKEF
jgi:hypothetical protein